MSVGTEIEYGVYIALRLHAIIRLRRFPRGSQVVCVTGRLWLTFDGDPEDHILMPGDWYLPARSARGAIIYAMEPSELVVLQGGKVTIGMIAERLLGGRFALRS